MNRVTKENLLGAFERYARAWESIGVDMSTLKMQHGNATMGVAYRITYNNGSNAPGTSDGFLGFTKREAWDTLRTMARVIEDMNHIRSVEKE
jgi:hypothetical protein